MAKGSGECNKIAKKSLHGTSNDNKSHIIGELFLIQECVHVTNECRMEPFNHIYTELNHILIENHTTKTKRKHI